MKKLIFTILLGVFFIHFSYSQTEKQTIAIDWFEWERNVNNAVGEGVQDAVINGFIKAGRFVVIDKEGLGLVKKEQDRQMSEVSISAENAERQAQMRELGADYIITGRVNGYSRDKKRVSTELITGEKKTYTRYTVKLQFTINALNAADGSVVGTEIINESSSSIKSYEEAMLDVLKSLDYEVELFIQKYFPLEIFIAEISSQKRGKAKEVLIAAGSELGIEKGDKFKVLEITMLSGMKREKEIGKIRVKEVEGTNFSMCKVNNGGEEIFKKFNEGKKIVCVSLEDSGAKKFVKGLGL